MPRPVFVGEERRGLAHVVEQRCPADKRVRRHAVQHARCVFEHVVYMVRRALLEAFHGHELGKHGSQHVDRGRERASGMLSKQQALQLVGDALGGDAGQQPLVRQHAFEGVRIDGEAQLRGEPAGAQHAQGVFGEAPIGVAYGSDDPRLQIGVSAVGVEQAARRVIG